MIPALLLILALLGTPLFIVIAASALYGFHQGEIDLSVVIIEIYRLVETPVLVAIPLFTLAGYLLSHTQASSRLVNLVDALFGWLPGGLALVALAACAMFTALTGASGVTIIALGALLYPALIKGGYAERFSLGLITSSGSLGLLFPPSIALILYGVIVQQVGVGAPVSIDELFVAGIAPGLLMLLLLGSWCVFHSPAMEKKPSDWQTIRKAVYLARWEIPIPFVVLGGIYGGVLAISEAAAALLLYVLVVSLFVLREIRPRQLSEIMHEAMVLIGGVLIILAVSLASTNYMVDAQIPQKLLAFVREYVDSKLTFLILLNLFLLMLGMMLDIFSALVIIVPLILPMAVSYGVHPVHLGIIFLANMQIGYFTPPVGMNLFIASFRFNRPVMELYRASIPFMFIMMLAVLIITYWPTLSLFAISQ
ncbi:MAG: TRAP transporter large permease subunit [Gammaproteobacteria bacterium]|nr:TRAP transporter large permease subunit [Gammaproteobacteria bacterium]